MKPQHKKHSDSSFTEDCDAERKGLIQSIMKTVYSVLILTLVWKFIQGGDSQIHVRLMSWIILTIKNFLSFHERVVIVYYINTVYSIVYIIFVIFFIVFCKR